jgi:hypothetical protein
MLERAAFLREQQVRFPTGFTRFLLGSYELRIFETANSWRSIRG